MYPERLKYLNWFQASGNRPHRYWPRKCEKALEQFFSRWGSEGTFILQQMGKDPIISSTLNLEGFKPIQPKYAPLIEGFSYLWATRPIWRFTMVTPINITNSIEIIGYQELVKCCYRIIRWLINGFENYLEFWKNHIPKVNKKELRLYGKKRTYPGSILNESRKKLNIALMRIINFLKEKLDTLAYRPNFGEIDNFIIYSRRLAYKAIHGTKTKRIQQALAPKNKFKAGGIINGGLKYYSGKFRIPTRAFKEIRR